MPTSPEPRVRPPHEIDAPLVTSRRGLFWIPGDIVEAAGATLQAGPMFVQWEAPQRITQPYPLVLVHGGGGQGTDWLTTVDGRPGWATRFVEAGFAVYVIDRAGHGRSPYHPDVLGEMGPPFPYEAAQGLFLAQDQAQEHTQWPYDREPGSPEVDQLVAAMGPLPADLAHSQTLDADRLAVLLDRIGPAVLVTHSAGGPVGWLAADRRPELVKGIAAVEPMGPPFADFPGLGPLTWGLTSAPMTFAPPATDPDELRAGAEGRYRLPALRETPVLLLTGGASAFATFTDQISAFLADAGADVGWQHLPDLGINGNGHGLLFEANSDDTVQPVIAWLTDLFSL